MLSCDAAMYFVMKIFESDFFNKRYLEVADIRV